MKYPLFVRILQDVLADKTRRKVTQQEVIANCKTLARQVLTRYEPDIVVAIATGGSVPGDMIAVILNIPVVHLLVRRNIKITRNYNLDPAPLRWMMSLYHHYLFRTMKPIVSVNRGLDVSGKKILIVEDTVHTGATIDVAVNYLMKLNALEIKVASFAHVAERRPDFSVLPQGNYCFPWSKDFNNTEA